MAVQCSVACVSDEDDGVVFGSDDLLLRGGFGVFSPSLFFPFSPFSLGSDVLWTATKRWRAMGRVLGQPRPLLYSRSSELQGGRLWIVSSTSSGIAGRGWLARSLRGRGAKGGKAMVRA